MTDKLAHPRSSMGPHTYPTRPPEKATAADRAAPQPNRARLPSGDLSFLSEGAPPESIRRLGEALARWQKLRQGPTPS